MNEQAVSTLSTSIEQACMVIRFERPRVLNALNSEMVNAFERALLDAEADPAIRAIVIIGSGRAFSVGTDLKEGGIDPDARVRHMHALILRIVRLSKVTVAAINGMALGGGLELAMACTFRVAATDAVLGLPEITHSLMPSYGGTQLLPRIIGAPRALELALLGAPISAARALEIGLVTQVNDDVIGTALALCLAATQGSETAQRAVRDAIREGLHLSLEAGLALEHRCVMGVADSAEAMAGVAHFNARTKAGS